MAQVIVRNLEDAVKRKLQRRAARHGRSIEQEVRAILRDAVKDEAKSRQGLGSDVAALFKRLGFEEEIREFKGLHDRAP
jgi:plasmid stability protein